MPTYVSPLNELIGDWLENHKRSWEWLFVQARLSPSISTGIRNSPTYKPRQETLWRLSNVMGVKVGDLLRAAGYSESEWQAFGDPGLTERELLLVSHFRLLPSDIQDSLLKITTQLLAHPTRRGAQRTEGRAPDDRLER